MTTLPRPEETARITSILQDHQQWSVFWDKRFGVWRVTEDDPDSELYAESQDAETIVGYIVAHS